MPFSRNQVKFWQISNNLLKFSTAKILCHKHLAYFICQINDINFNIPIVEILITTQILTFPLWIILVFTKSEYRITQNFYGYWLFKYLTENILTDGDCLSLYTCKH